MLLTLSTEEMLGVWKLKRYFEPLRSDCELTRTDGIDLNRLQLMEMREWYLNLLDKGDLSLLQVSDISRDVALKHLGDGSATITLPAECRRVIELKLDGWNRPAILVSPGSPIAALQQSPYSRGNVEEPVAITHCGYLHIYTPPSTTARIVTLKCVLEPAEGKYVIDERALATIPADII